MSTRQKFFLILLYFIPIPGLPYLLRRYLWPTVDESFIEQAGYVLVQAFGRGTYADKALQHELDELFDEDYGNLQECFRRLRNADFNPGSANVVLARCIQRMMKINPRLVVISQWEVMFALCSLDRSFFSANRHRLDCIWPEGSYFATVHVKTASKVVIERRQLDPHNGIELAHPDMAIRATLILWKLRLRPAIYISQIPFAPDSVQLWTRNRWLWFPRETLGRLQHIVVRWVSFSPPSE